MKRLVFILLALSLARAGFAVNYTWTGGSFPFSPNWNNNQNWAPAGFPANNGDTATFGAGSSGPVTINNSYTIGELIINAGSTVTITQNAGCTLTVQTGGGHTGDFLMGGGTFNQNDTVSVNHDFTLSGGVYNQNATLSVTTNNRYLNINGGTFNNNSSINASLVTTAINMAGSVNLSNVGNNFSGVYGVTVTNAVNVSLSDTTYIIFNSVNMSGNLNVTALGAAGSGYVTFGRLATDTITVGGNLNAASNNDYVSQLAGTSVTVTGNLTVNAGTYINLNNLAVNSASNIELHSGTYSTIVNANTVNLTNSTIGTDLTVTASSGNITDVTALNVTGNSTFTVANGQDIILDNAADTFTGTLAFTPSAGQIRNIRIYDTTALAIPALDITGYLDAQTFGATANITNSGIVRADLTGTFQANTAGATITLGTVNTLDVTGNIQLVTAGGNATVTNARPIIFTGTSIAGVLTATVSGAVATGNISQADAMSVTGNASFTDTNGQNIYLDNSGNSFGGTLAFTPSAGQLNNIVIYDTTAIAIPAIDITGYLDAQTFGAAGNITNSGIVRVDLTGTFQANTAGATITLGTVNTLDVTGAIQAVTAGGNATITNATAIVFTGTTVNGNLTTVATTGNITDNNTVTVTGTAHFTTSGAGADMTLDTLAVTGTIELDSTAPNGDANITNATAIAFTGTTVNGNLTAVATTGNITDNNTVTVTGTAHFTTSGAGADMTLDTLAVTGTIELDTTAPNGDAAVTNATAIVFTGTTVNGNLTAVATTGNITDNNTVTVTGTAHFTTLGAGADMTLDTLAVTGTIELDTTAPNGDVSLTNATAVAFTGTTVNGNLTTVATLGTITDSSALVITGTGDFTVLQANQSITLDNLDTSAFTPTISADTNSGTADIVLVASDAIILGNLSPDRDLSVTANNGDITDTGTLTVAGGTATLAAGANNIALDTLVNNIPNVTISSPSNITLASNNVINLTTAAGPNNPIGLDVNVSSCNLAADLNLDGNLRISGGIFNVNIGPVRQINISGNWNNAGGTFQPQTGRVTFDGATCALQSDETFYDLTVQNTFSLDVAGQVLTVTNAFNIENGATLYRAGTVGESAPTDTNSGLVCYRGAAGGTVQDYGAGDDYFNLSVGLPAGTFTLSADARIVNDLTIDGGTLSLGGFQVETLRDFVSNSGVCNLGTGTLTVNRNFDRSGGGTFNAGTGTVEFVNNSLTSQVRGSTTFYNFTCIVPGKTIEFENSQTLTIPAGGRFTITGAAGNLITLQSTVAQPGGPYDNLQHPEQWNITINAGGFADVTYAHVVMSWATNPIFPDDNTTFNTPDDWCHNWLLILTVSSSGVEDSDGDGKIDRIRVQAVAVVDDGAPGAFAGLTVSIEAPYYLVGYSTGPGVSTDDTFYINIARSDYELDTYSTPRWSIDANSSLHSTTGSRYVFTTPLGTPYSQTPADEADPVIGYTLARADSHLVYVQLSEPVANAGGGPISTANFSYGGAPDSVTPIGTREYMLNFTTAAFTLADIAAGATVTYQNIVDLSAASNQLGALSVTHPLSDMILNFTGHEAVTLAELYDAMPKEPGPEGIGYITRFDGSEWLTYPVAPGTLTFNYTNNIGTPIDIVYYMDTASTYQNLPLWYPTPPAFGVPVYGLVAQYQAGVVNINPAILGTVAFTNDSLFEFYFRFTVPNLLCGRLTQPASAAWYQSVRPFAFGIHRPGGQKGGVEIYNNVINPNNGDLAKIRYTLPRDGNVTIQVFSLSGDVVGLLYRGWLTAGQHSTTWNGYNQGGRVVARGLYFIKVVGPGIDETRKVLVVK